MILLAYDAALRREELMSLRVDDFNWSSGVVTIRPETTKGGRMRHVPVSAYALHLLRQYIEGDRRTPVAAYDAEDSGPVFLSESTRNPGRPLAVGAFDEIMERVREKVGLPAPHTAHLAPPAMHNPQTSRRESRRYCVDCRPQEHRDDTALYPHGSNRTEQAHPQED